MKVPGIVERGRIRPKYAVKLPPDGAEVEIVLPETKIDDEERARRKKVGALHRRLRAIDIRPLTTTQIVREDRDGR